MCRLGFDKDQVLAVSTGCLGKKSRPLLHGNFGKCRHIFSNIVVVKFRNDLLKKLELKLPPPLKSVATLPCEGKCSTIQLYGTVISDQSDAKMLNYSKCPREMLIYGFRMQINYNMCSPRAGSGVLRIDLLRFLAGCRTRRLNQV